MKCERCGQDLPLEPAWVVPGDIVFEKGTTNWAVVLRAGECEGRVEIALALDNGGRREWPVCDITLDDRPVAGFRDPRDEAISTLRERRDYLGGLVDRCNEQLDEANREIRKLERKLEAAKIKDEDINTLWGGSRDNLWVNLLGLRDRIAKRVEETT